MTGAWRRRSASCNSAAWRTVAPTNSPAASSSAWHWHAPLVNRPKVLLLDEPLGALDLKLRQEMQLELKALQREVGITFVFVTHDQEEALTMSDRIAVMHEGRLLQVGTPEDIYQRPANRFVADFIGRDQPAGGARWRRTPRSCSATACGCGPLPTTPSERRWR